MNDRAKIRNIICAILSIILAVVLGYLYYTNQQQGKEQAVAVEVLQAEAKEYENELQDWRSELSALQSNVSYSSENAEIMVGFNISDVSDLSYIEEKAGIYDFSPVLVINCTMALADIEEIIEGADVIWGSDGNWEIMLYATDFLQNVNDDVLSVLSCLEGEDQEHSGIFFLRDAYSGTANIQLLMEDGFIGYTCYHDEALAVGQTDDGMVYFEYHYLSEEGTDISERLSALYNSKSSMIVMFDMASINSGSLSETYVDALFGTMQAYTEYDDCAFSAVADVVQELSQVNSIEADNQAAYEEQAAEIQERIDELQEIIDGIYGKWDMEE